MAEPLPQLLCQQADDFEAVMKPGENLRSDESFVTDAVAAQISGTWRLPWSGLWAAHGVRWPGVHIPATSFTPWLSE
jgi:hypothetical protein